MERFLRLPFSLEWALQFGRVIQATGAVLEGGEGQAVDGFSVAARRYTHGVADGEGHKGAIDGIEPEYDRLILGYEIGRGHSGDDSCESANLVGFAGKESQRESAYRSGGYDTGHS